MASGKKPSTSPLQGGGDRAPSQDDSDLQTPARSASSPSGLSPGVPQTPTPSRRGRADRGPRQLVRWDGEFIPFLVPLISSAFASAYLLLFCSLGDVCSVV